MMQVAHQTLAAGRDGGRVSMIATASCRRSPGLPLRVPSARPSLPVPRRSTPGGHVSAAADLCPFLPTTARERPPPRSTWRVAVHGYPQARAPSATRTRTTRSHTRGTFRPGALHHSPSTAARPAVSSSPVCMNRGPTRSAAPALDRLRRRGGRRAGSRRWRRRAAQSQRGRSSRGRLR